MELFEFFWMLQQPLLRSVPSLSLWLISILRNLPKCLVTTSSICEGFNTEDWFSSRLGSRKGEVREAPRLGDPFQNQYANMRLPESDSVRR